MINLKAVFKDGVLKTKRRYLRDKFSQRYNFIRLDLNENLKELTQDHYASFIQYLTPEKLSTYPDLSTVYTSMANFMQVDEDNITLTNGSDMAIRCIFDACIQKGDHLIIHNPCYLMYERYAQFFEAEIDLVSIKEDWSLDIPLMLSKIKPNTKLFVLESPSGNLGAKINTCELEVIAAYLEQRNIMLVVDEAYLYVNNISNENNYLIRKFSNVILIRSMSKAFGLAGARIGILVSNSQIMQELYKIRPLFEISELSALAAQWRLANLELLIEYQEMIKKSKEFIFREFDELGLEYKDTDGNFIMVKFSPINGYDFFTLLKEEGILIGKKFELPLLKDWWRITLGDIHHLQILLQKIKKLIAHQTN